MVRTDDHADGYADASPHEKVVANDIYQRGFKAGIVYRAGEVQADNPVDAPRGAPSLTLLPPGWTTYYEYGEPPDERRESYTLLGFALDEPAEPRQAADLHHATYLLVLRKDGKATFLTMSRMTIVPPGSS